MPTDTPPGIPSGHTAATALRILSATCCASAGRRTREEHRKLVAADPRDEIRPANASLHGRRDPPEQLVARGMTQRVVHPLEAVEIERQQRAGSSAPLQPVELLREASCVPGAGEDVSRRELRQPSLTTLALGDVGCDEEPSRRVPAARP